MVKTSPTWSGFALSPTFDWRDMWQADHAAAFTVAKSAGLDILGDVHSALVDALARPHAPRPDEVLVAVTDLETYAALLVAVLGEDRGDFAARPRGFELEA